MFAKVGAQLLTTLQYIDRLLIGLCRLVLDSEPR